MKTDLQVSEYRKFADECRVQATKSRQPADGERWSKLAADWLKMAEQADGMLAESAKRPPDQLGLYHE